MSVLYKDLNLTNFPDAIDVFTQWLDIVASDGPLIKQYMQAVENGNTVSANEILAQIPSGAQKIIKANDLNKLTQAMLALERFYGMDVKPYVETKQDEWNKIINQFDYKGKWSSGVSYQKDNMVSFTRFGDEIIYLAIDNVPSGTPTSDTKYWRLFTIRGAQGTSGRGLSYREEWKNNELYSENDAVTYGGALWMAIQPSQSVEPTQGSSAWKLIMSLQATTYPITDIQPENQAVGDLWFNTQKNPTRFYYLKALQMPATSKDIVDGKEAYDDEGRLIVGVGKIDGGAEWNDGSTFSWNE